MKFSIPGCRLLGFVLAHRQWGSVSLSNCICLNESSCSAFKSLVQTDESSAVATGSCTENVRNIKIVLLNCFSMVEGYQEILELQAIFSL